MARVSYMYEPSRVSSPNFPSNMSKRCTKSASRDSYSGVDGAKPCDYVCSSFHLPVRR